ncbi:MAG: hypothetical protein JNL60_01920 [Bacteroidia bacterium]|nr:hypothetical protein [Bacteroidia bacterium]
MVRIIKIAGVLILLGLVLVGSFCSLRLAGERSNEKEFVGNVSQKEIGEFTFSLKPISSEKMFIINYGDTLSNDTRETVLKEYDEFLCYVFEIDIKGFDGSISEYDILGKSSDYEKKNKYYLFDMQRDIKLTNAKGGEIPCSIFFQEQLNHIISSNRFIIGFRCRHAGDMILEYDNPYLNCGKVNIALDNKINT